MTPYYADGRGRGQFASKTHCSRGHEFTPENTKQMRDGKSCRACENITQRARRAARVATCPGAAQFRGER